MKRKLLTTAVIAVSLLGFDVANDAVQLVQPTQAVQAAKRKKSKRKARKARRRRTRRNKRRAKKSKHRKSTTYNGTKNDHYNFFHGGFYYSNGITMTFPKHYEYVIRDNWQAIKGFDVLFETKITNNSKNAINIADFIKKHYVIMDNHKTRTIDYSSNVDNGNSAELENFNSELKPKESKTVMFGFYVSENDYTMFNYVKVLNNNGQPLTQGVSAPTRLN